ncbi:MAG: metallophosphoesterase [Candidatus Thorarchaeota archaeon]
MDLKLLKNEPALLLQEGKRRILVVADLHIGYERTLFRQDQYTANLSERIIQHLLQIVTETKPNEVIILGDIKHTIKEFSQQEFRKVALLLQRIQDLSSLTIIRGNHDADLELVIPDNTQIIPSSGLKLTFRKHNVFLLHGHAQPSVEFLSCESLLMAHVHPVLAIPSLKSRFITHRVWVRTRWNPSIVDAANSWFQRLKSNLPQDANQHLLEMRILILPAFLNLLRGHIINRMAKNPRLGTPLFQHLALNEAEIIMLDQTPLGQLKQLYQDLRND